MNKIPMKIFISMPPLDKFISGVPQISQNRQYQEFGSHSTIYPILLASAATLLKSKGYDVTWDDAITKRKKYDDWIKKIAEVKPDVIAIESKTPCIKYHWEITKDIKKVSEYTSVVLMGDHVTEMPDESIRNGADLVIKGGDYDISLLNLMERLEGKKETKFESLDELPFVDRDLTCWEDYAYENGNYKNTPATYTLAARDCHWGRCRFCSWASLYPPCSYKRRSPESLIEEIQILVEKYGVKEIMEDSGTIPYGDWLKRFCELMIETGLNKKIKISCNVRFGVLGKADYELLRRSGFRLLLFGLESANQAILDSIDKGIKTQDIWDGCKWASQAGLSPHVTIMTGMPLETKETVEETLLFVKKLISKNYISTLQSTFVVAYPNTPLYKECLEKDLLLIEDGDWKKFNMRHQIIKTGLTEEETKDYVSKFYKLSFNFKFILHQFLSIRCWDDFSYLLRAARIILTKHLPDFKNG
ncbi:MAG: radical SAM protein [Candidatus Asgardarchaeum sp.]